VRAPFGGLSLTVVFLARQPPFGAGIREHAGSSAVRAVRVEAAAVERVVFPARRVLVVRMLCSRDVRGQSRKFDARKKKSVASKQHGRRESLM
jgi:hypothetical protein